MIVADARFSGEHGIARYAREVLPAVAVDRTLTTGRALLQTPADPLFLRAQLIGRRARGFYSPGYSGAWDAGSRIRQLLTIHDLITYEVPGETSRARQAYFQAVTFPAIRRAGAVVTVSEFSRDRIAAASGLPAERIVVAPCGLSDAFAAVSDGPAPIDRPYVLFVGNAKPYKRFEACAAAVRSVPDLTLVTAGVRGAPDPSGRVVHLPTLDDGRLAAAYRSALAVVLPSRYEGFGLPVLEAMSQGTPVVYCAQAGREIIGELGFKLPPDAPAAALADVIDHAARSRSPESSAALIARARGYSWPRTAAAVADAVARVVG